MSGTPSWKIEGDYFEACNCDTVCPCVFLGNPDKGECDVVLAWHIQKGHYENTSLNDLNAVAVFHTPGNMFTGPNGRQHFILMRKRTKNRQTLLARYTQDGLVVSLAFLRGLLAS
jgi:hypothetical protein